MRICAEPVRLTALTASTLALPPTKSRTLRISASPSGELAAGAAEAAAGAPPAAAGFGAAPPGSGMVTSTAWTLPSEESGLSRSFSLPTTSSAIWSGWTYCRATRDTSSAVTLRMFSGYWS